MSLLATVTVCFAIHAFEVIKFADIRIAFAETLAPSRREAAVIVASLSTVLPSASVTLSDMPLSVSVREEGADAAALQRFCGFHGRVLRGGLALCYKAGQSFNHCFRFSGQNP